MRVLSGDIWQRSIFHTAFFLSIGSRRRRGASHNYARDDETSGASPFTKKEKKEREKKSRQHGEGKKEKKEKYGAAVDSLISEGMHAAARRCARLSNRTVKPAYDASSSLSRYRKSVAHFDSSTAEYYVEFFDWSANFRFSWMSLRT